MLKNELEQAKRSVSTDSLRLSIGEIASMYSSNELDIIPEFQRLFRWPIEKKTALVESILIGIPVPPVFAYENENGTWELVDGLQRISTILEFMGLLRDPSDTSLTLPGSQLCQSSYLPSLKGVVWKKQSETTTELDKPLQLFFRRSRLEFQILKHPSDPKTKFDLFRRLNRGGEYANEQEVRTCSMVLGNPTVTRRIRKLASSEMCIQLFQVSDDQKKKQKDIEYLVRTIVLSAENLQHGMDVQEFLDTGIVNVITDDRSSQLIDDVEWAISTLFRLYGENALLPHEHAISSINRKQVSLRAVESILVGIVRNIRQIRGLSDSDKYIQEKIDKFWRQEEVAALSAPGQRGTTRILKTIPFGENWFKV